MRSSCDFVCNGMHYDFDQLSLIFPHPTPRFPIPVLHVQLSKKKAPTCACLLSRIFRDASNTAFYSMVILLDSRSALPLSLTLQRYSSSIHGAHVSENMLNYGF